MLCFWRKIDIIGAMIGSYVVGREDPRTPKSKATHYLFERELPFVGWSLTTWFFCSRMPPFAFGAESFESYFSAANGNCMIALRAGRQRPSWQAPGGGRRAMERHCPYRPPLGSQSCGANSPPCYCTGQTTGRRGGGVTLQPAELPVFQRRFAMDPVLILTSSLNTSLRVLVLISRQN